MKRKLYQVQKQRCAGTLAAHSGVYACLTSTVPASASKKDLEVVIATAYVGVACARKSVR
jgi:hypothetical protein